MGTATIIITYRDRGEIDRGIDLFRASHEHGDADTISFGLNSSVRYTVNDEPPETFLPAEAACEVRPERDQ